MIEPLDSPSALCYVIRKYSR